MKWITPVESKMNWKTAVVWGIVLGFSVFFWAVICKASIFSFGG